MYNIKYERPALVKHGNSNRKNDFHGGHIHAQTKQLETHKVAGHG